MIHLNPILLAGVLLGMRLIALSLIFIVFLRQIKNLRTLHTDFPAVRWVVFILTLVLLLGQIIPIMLDASVVFSDNMNVRSDTPSLLQAGYAFNNATKDVIIGILLCLLYFRLGIRKADR